MKTSSEGILYPKDALSVLKDSLFNSIKESNFNYSFVPHASWQVCKKDLDRVFSSISKKNYDYIFVLAPLHKGKISFDDSFSLYTPEDGLLEGSDWVIKLECPNALKSFCTISDDICSEEHSLEVIAPYLALLFKDSKICYVLAAESDSKIGFFMKLLKKDFPNSLILVSDNNKENCAYMWKEFL